MQEKVNNKNKTLVKTSNPTKKKWVLPLLIGLGVLLIALVMVFIFFFLPEKEDFVPSNFSVTIDKDSDFFIMIDWDDVEGATGYVIEYKNMLYPDTLKTENTVESELFSDRIRGILTYRVKTTLSNGDESAFSDWQNHNVEPMRLDFSFDPTLTKGTDNKYILNFLPVMYYIYPYSIDYIVSYEIQEMLPQETSYRDSTYINANTHTFNLPQGASGILKVRIRALNQTVIRATDPITGMPDNFFYNEPKELFDYYDPSEWIEITIQVN